MSLPALAHALDCMRMCAQGQGIGRLRYWKRNIAGKGKGEWFADNKTVHHVTSIQSCEKVSIHERGHASQLRENSCTRLELFSFHSPFFYFPGKQNNFLVPVQTRSIRNRNIKRDR